MTSLEIIKKLVLYAEHQRRLHDPLGTDVGSPTQRMAEARRLKKELLAAGISPELLDLSGDDIAQTITESLMKQKHS